MISDNIPKYYIETEEFKALANAYDTVIQPILDALKAVFRHCRAPIYMSKDELLPILLAAGYDEAKSMSESDMRNLFLDILKNRRLMTDDAFVKQLRRVFETQEGESDPWELRIRRCKNVVVTVDTPIEQLDSPSVHYTDSNAFVYDILAKNIMLSFPAGVRLKLNANMKSDHICYVGAYSTMTIQMFGEIVPVESMRYLYDAAHVRKRYAYNSENRTYEVNGNWITEDELQSEGLYTKSVMPYMFYDRNALNPKDWSFPATDEWVWVRPNAEIRENVIDFPYDAMKINDIFRGSTKISPSSWSDAQYSLYTDIWESGVMTGNGGLRLSCSNDVLSRIPNDRGLMFDVSAYIPVEDVVNTSMYRRGDTEHVYNAYRSYKRGGYYFFVFDGENTIWRKGANNSIYDVRGDILSTYETYNGSVDSTVFYDPVADEYSYDNANSFARAYDFYGDGYIDGFGYSVGCIRGNSPSIMIYKRPQDFTKIGDAYMVAIPLHYLNNNRLTIRKRLHDKGGMSLIDAGPFIDDAISDNGIMWSGWSYSECENFVSWFDGTVVKAYILEAFDSSTYPYRDYAFAYVDELFVDSTDQDGNYTHETRYGIDGQEWKTATGLHEEDKWTIKPSTYVDVWDIATGLKVEDAFVADPNEPEAGGMYCVDGGWYAEGELQEAGYSLTEPMWAATYTAYSRSAAYQNSNQSLANAGDAPIYAPGESVVLAGDTHKDYVITGMWNAAGTNVYKNYVGLSCYLYSGNPRIRIRNRSDNSISWNRIEYVAYDLFRIYLRQDHTDMEINPGANKSNCYDRNGMDHRYRTPNETYTVVAAYKADGTPVDITPLRVTYDTTWEDFRVKVNTGYGSRTLAYVDFKVTG